MLEAEPELVNVAGRMVLKRVMGKASFATIQDMNGRIQLYIANDVAGMRRTTHSSTMTSAIYLALKVRCSEPEPASFRFASRVCAC